MVWYECKECVSVSVRAWCVYARVDLSLCCSHFLSPIDFITHAVIFTHPYNRCRSVKRLIYNFIVFARHAKNYAQNSWITNFCWQIFLICIFEMHWYRSWQRSGTRSHAYTCISSHPMSPRDDWVELIFCRASWQMTTHHSWCVKK